MDFSNWRFRAHAMHSLMGEVKLSLSDAQEKTYKAYLDRANGNGKPLTEKQIITLGDLVDKKQRIENPRLSTGAKTYLKNLHSDIVLGRSNNIESKYLEKGISVEDKSILLYSTVTDDFFMKNEERKSNDYFTGCVDMWKNGGGVRDIKSSWSYETFPIHDTKIKLVYFTQLQTYMDLYEEEKAYLVYCLVNTPFHLIDKEIKGLDWKYGIMDGNGDIFKEHIPLVVEKVSNHIFSIDALKDYCHQSPNVCIEWFDNFKEVAPQNRVKEYVIDRDEKYINAMKKQVKIAREYLNELSINLMKW